MENSDAAQMVGEWGCNNIILGTYMYMYFYLNRDNDESDERQCSLYAICEGGDLVFFIDGLQKTVKEVKKTIGEDVPEEEVGGPAV